MFETVETEQVGVEDKGFLHNLFGNRVKSKAVNSGNEEQQDRRDSQEIVRRDHKVFQVFGNQPRRKSNPQRNLEREIKKHEDNH
jgi:hypothetical protein